MPSISRLIVSACAATFSSIAFAACDIPGDVSVPDGATASNEEMVNGQNEIKEYMSAMEAYLACMDKEEADLDRDPTDEELSLHNEKHNAAVDAMETVAAAFNEQVRAYKKQTP